VHTSALPGLSCCCPRNPYVYAVIACSGGCRSKDPPEALRDVTGLLVRGTMAVARGLTALVAGVRKCADNNGGQASKRSHEAAQGQVHKGTQEVEEQSRWRWSPRRFGVHRNQTGSFPLKGPGRSAGPLSCAHLRAARAVVLLPA
jgi:hypothetical protein